MTKNKIFIAALILTLLLALSACGGGNATPEDDLTTNTTEQEDTQTPQEETEDTGEDTTTEVEPTEEPLPEYPDFDPLPAERQPVEIMSSDDRVLEGYYYPAKVPDAPVVVLMHWAGGDMEDWKEIAPWLQNRQDETGMRLGSPVKLASLRLSVSGPWLDPTWFPPMPKNASFAVLVFNFGGYGNSPEGTDRDSLLDDALLAIYFATTLEGVDPNKVSAIGASIGADGVVDACSVYNKGNELGTCIGALSLSPGNYITDQFTYQEAVSVLDIDGHPVWCFAAADDYSSPELCRTSTGDHYLSVIYPGDPHGMFLLDPALLPIEPASQLNSMQLIQEWLEAVYGLTLNEITFP